MALQPARLLSRRDWAPGLATVQLDVAPRFEAGQFFNLALELAGEQTVKRAYSAASAPGAQLELYLTEVAAGALTPGLFRLNPGDEVLVDPEPQGFFTLRYMPDARDLWLIATGTGLGPFISMLRSDEPWRRFQRLIVVHGVREVAHLGYLAELQGLAASPRSGGAELRHVPCVSREPPPAGGVAGRIPLAIERGELERAAGVELAPEHSHVALCGNPDIIADVQAVLGARGLVKHRQRKPGHISFEKYW